jgi:biofilm PGA synthesis N-glycosyltransferase PgaC
MLKICFLKSDTALYFWAMDWGRILSEGDLFFWIIAALFFAGWIIQCYYYLGIYLRLFTHRPPEPGNQNEPVSVIICARNEAMNLERFLPEILTQDYPEFEVIVVNDRSTDHTEEVLSRLTEEHPHLRFTSIPVNQHQAPGKKLALTLGMKSATHSIVLLTDADCRPSGPHWIRQMVRHLYGDTQIVLGYGAYLKEKGLLNLLIRYETVFTAMQYLSFAISGWPYMGVGRNLAYRKEVFFEGKGFARHYHLASGDDDLFVNEHARKGNTAVEYQPGSHTLSIPKSNLGAWIKQKRRHVSAGSMYRRASRLRLGLEYGSRLLFYVTFIILCFTSPFILPVLAAFVLFQVCRMTSLKLGMKRLNERYLLLPSLLFDPLLPLILGVIWMGSISVTKYQPWS